ncbi:hypothetical protein CANCADRAFT_55980 [Tortispora caseinolytica NRRL Y-17796]|uniref:Uncharacterized protein n=1 Tax=Tortispora caseinolytica NRRL Y-17796 TaxID=767744 RepID=A0A1E4TKK2_9ASCO|nr:hypothetical protein CANCADRAFT_55980 [Tortispora caseinolytica NRRL Y-17796]
MCSLCFSVLFVSLCSLFLCALCFSVLFVSLYSLFLYPCPRTKPRERQFSSTLLNKTTNERTTLAIAGS